MPGAASPGRANQVSCRRRSRAGILFDAPDPLVGALFGARYRLLDRVGQGGMGAVYRARDEQLEMICAVKVVLSALTDANRDLLRSRLELEAKTMARLRTHPNVVAVLGIGEQGGHQYLVMEFLPAGSVYDRLVRDGPLPPRMAVGVVRAVLSALEMAHGLGVVHRDAKPQNILIAPNGVPKLSDFGIARAHQNMWTRTGTPLGTLGFMPPEQHLAPRAVDGRADLFAVGATFYTLLTGCEPLHIIAADVEDSLFWQGVPIPLRQVIKKATAYRREDRFDGAKAMAAALDAAVSGLPPDPDGPPLVTAPPVGEPVPRWPTGAAADAQVPYLLVEVLAREPTPPVPPTLPAPAPRPRRRWAFVIGVGLIVVSFLAAWWPRPSPAVDYRSATTGYPMVRISPAPGGFLMGSDSSEQRDDDEAQHRVHLSRDLLVGVTEVTQAQWFAVMRDQPVTYGTTTAGVPCAEVEGFTLVGNNRPVVCVTWCAAIRFANRLSVEDLLPPAYSGVGDCENNPSGVSWNKAANGYRLPTEAEWEYAARAGAAGAHHREVSAEQSCTLGNFADQTASEALGAVTDGSPCQDGYVVTAPVGSFVPNAFGLHDMVGNVWEWTWDWYGPYDPANDRDPSGPDTGTLRTRRSGSFDETWSRTRSANRGHSAPYERNQDLGLRLVRWDDPSSVYQR